MRGGDEDVEETIAGERLVGTGDASCGLSKLITTSPVGFMIGIRALFRSGILNSVVFGGAGLLVGRLDEGVWLVVGAVIGVCDLPRLELGRSEADMAEGFRDICGGGGELLYWPTV